MQINSGDDQLLLNHIPEYGNFIKIMLENIYSNFRLDLSSYKKYNSYDVEKYMLCAFDPEYLMYK